MEKFKHQILQKKSSSKGHKSHKSFWQLVLLIVSIVFIFYGIYRDEVNVIFQKAIYICLECIGIG